MGLSKSTRILARKLARQLTEEELAAVSGGSSNTQWTNPSGVVITDTNNK